MDLHFTADEPTAEEREAVDGCLAELCPGLAAEAAAPGDGGQQLRADVPGVAGVAGAAVAAVSGDGRAGAAATPPANGRRQFLLPVLHAVQGRVGWISPGAVNHVCRRLEVPPAEAYGVADFYALFQTRPHPPVTVHVCDDIACRFGPAAQATAALRSELERTLGPAGASLDGRVTWHPSPCLGLCERAPAALVLAAGSPPHEAALAPATVEAVRATVEGRAAPAMDAVASVPQLRRGAALQRPANLDQRRPAADAERSASETEPALAPAVTPGWSLLSRIGRVDPESLDDYRAAGGFLALRRALEMGPERVVREVIDSKLVGRGGAAFPTGQKWLAVRSAPLPRYLVCNADESEPGTFKDRVLMEGDPFAVVEAMIIAGFATGCESGYVYVRGEYPLAAERLAGAIRLCRARGYLGGDVLGHGVRFDVELRRGAGAYICGEEMALINSLEGRRGEPRNKPPFPTQVGLFGKPTVINNVETLVNVLPIVLGGGRAFAAVGTERSTGTKLFCVSGHVARPGLYEVTFGVTLRQLLELAGGPGDGGVQAVLLGGAAGVFVTPDQLDVPLTFEGTRSIGASLGSGVVMPFDRGVDLRQVLRRIAQFFRDESCGQCVPCRVGAVRQEEVLARLAAGRPLGSVGQELALLAELGQVMRDASICGLGQTASSAVESAVAKLPIFQEMR